jgi:hypothetical protein
MVLMRRNGAWLGVPGKSKRVKSLTPPDARHTLRNALRMKRQFSLLLLAFAAHASALTIVIDYNYDGGFFSANPLAKTALEKAAGDLGQIIGPSLSAVPGGPFSGTSGNTDAGFTWNYSFANPSAPATPLTIPITATAADEFTIFAGARLLSGSTLGVGSRAGLSLQFSASGFSNEFAAAVAGAEAASNAALRRGAGPLMGTITGSAQLGAVTANYTLETGALAGVMAFDLDTPWHFDVNTLPAGSESDFYSVALHEMMHTLGIGTALTWDSLRSGTNWSGLHATALTSGANLVTTDGHIAEGTMSVTLAGGLAQEVVMDPSITVGTRKVLTRLDAAFLQDLGYNAVPEPGITALLGVAALVAMCARRRG